MFSISFFFFGFVVRIHWTNSLLDTSPLGCGLRYYVWTDKCRQEACTLSWMVVWVFACSFQRWQSKGSQLFSYYSCSPNKQLLSLFWLLVEFLNYAYILVPNVHVARTQTIGFHLSSHYAPPLAFCPPHSSNVASPDPCGCCHSHTTPALWLPWLPLTPAVHVHFFPFFFNKYPFSLVLKFCLLIHRLGNVGTRGPKRQCPWTSLAVQLQHLLVKIIIIL